MKFYGNGAVCHNKKSKVLCRFIKGEYETVDKYEIEYLIEKGYKNDGIQQEEERQEEEIEAEEEPVELVVEEEPVMEEIVDESADEPVEEVIEEEPVQEEKPAKSNKSNKRKR